MYPHRPANTTYRHIGHQVVQELGPRLGVRVDEGAAVKGLVARFEQRNDGRVVHLVFDEWAHGMD